MCITLGQASDVATILTAIVAVIAYFSYKRERWSNRKRLEAYLREEKATNPKPAHTMKHLIAKVGMSEAEIYRAIFDSKYIERLIRSDPATGLADENVFVYKDD